MSQQALERGDREMRRQIAELKAEAARADIKDKKAGRSSAIPFPDCALL
jgi:hypothetical protein